MKRIGFLLLVLLAPVAAAETLQLDGELAERLASVEGIANVSLTARKGAGHLRLVA